jgi:iron complex outermembrane recepter protein
MYLHASLRSCERASNETRLAQAWKSHMAQIARLELPVLGGPRRATGLLADPRLATASAVFLMLAIAAPSDLFAAEQDATLEEIIVTAQKREQTLQEVPIAISALSGKDLSELGARDFVDYAYTIPGLSFSDRGAGREKLSIRGINVTTGSPAVTYYIGETPIPATTGTLRLASVNPKLIDMDRIEVLRGPQGTLYGSSSVGGTIKFIPQAPRFDSFSGDLNARASSTHDGGLGLDVDATANVPIVDDTLAMRGSVWHTDQEGFITRRLIDELGGPVAPGLTNSKSDIPTEKTSGERLILSYKPTQAVTISGLVMHQEQDFNGFQDITVGATNQAQGLFQDMLLPVDEPSNMRFSLYSITANVDLGPARVVSATSYYEGDLIAVEEGVAAVQLFFGGPAFSNSVEENNGSHTFTQEIRLATSQPILGVDGLLGGYFSRADVARTIFWSPPGWNSTFGPGLLTPNNNLFAYQFSQTQKERSGFGELTWHTTDSLALTAGLRHYDIDTQSLSITSGLFQNFSDPGHVDVASLAANSTGHVIKVNTSYNLTRQHLLYAQYSEGFRPGFGLAPLPTQCLPDLGKLGITGEANQVGPDTTKNYELGAKTTWNDNKLTLNAALYQIDWDNIQQSSFLPCGFTFTQNAGTARNKGVEVELRALVFQRVDVGGSLSYINSAFLKDAPALNAKAGDRIPDVPEWQGAVYASIPFAMPNEWEGRFRVDFQYTGSTTIDYQQINGALDPLSRRAPLSLLNARFGFSKGPLRWEFYGDNLLDNVELMSRAESLAVTVPGRPRFVVNRPRTLGITGSYAF